MGVKMCVATSSSKVTLDLKTGTKHKDFFSRFSHIVTGCDHRLKTAKPSPDIFLLAAAEFSPDQSSAPPPSSCLVFEDAPLGVEAGIAAGMQVVMIPHHKTRKEYLLQAT